MKLNRQQKIVRSKPHPKRRMLSNSKVNERKVAYIDRQWKTREGTTNLLLVTVLLRSVSVDL